MTDRELMQQALDALEYAARIVDLQMHIENFDGEDR
jgi:hypothetical protein